MALEIVRVSPALRAVVDRLTVPDEVRPLIHVPLVDAMAQAIFMLVPELGVARAARRRMEISLLSIRQLLDPFCQNRLL